MSAFYHFILADCREETDKGLKGREILAINLRSECVKSALLRLVSM